MLHMLSIHAALPCPRLLGSLSSSSPGSCAHFPLEKSSALVTRIQLARHRLAQKYPDAVFRREGKLWRVFVGRQPFGEACDNIDDAVLSVIFPPEQSRLHEPAGFPNPWPAARHALPAMKPSP
jgi:hypothetical protein